MSGAGMGWTEVQSPLHSRISFLGSFYHPEALVPSVGHLLASRMMDTKEDTALLFLHLKLPGRDVRPVVLGRALQAWRPSPSLYTWGRRDAEISQHLCGPQLVDNSWGWIPGLLPHCPALFTISCYACPHRAHLAPQAFSGGCGHCVHAE